MMVCYNTFMFSKTPLLKRLAGNRSQAEVFHSSGVARVVSGRNMGSASAESFATRRQVDDSRRFVRSYNNARIINDAYAFERVRKHIPRTGQAQSDTSATARNKANQIKSYGAKDLDTDAKSYGKKDLDANAKSYGCKNAEAAGGYSAKKSEISSRELRSTEALKDYGIKKSDVAHKGHSAQTASATAKSSSRIRPDFTPKFR